MERRPKIVKSKRLDAFLGGVAMFGEGFASIGQGMADLFPERLERPAGSLASDSDAIARDREKVVGHLYKAMRIPRKENNG